MAQQVEFPGFLHSPVPEWVDSAHQLVGYVDTAAPDRKALREWMRERTLWDRETAPAALALLGVSMTPKPGLAEPARGLLDCAEQEDQKRYLFTRLRGMNLLLAKYALEALDPENGGRLHSTHELFRMIDSYVYPGERIPLRNFEEWIRWMTAVDGIRQIGIRWGLGDQGRASMDWLRGHDVEEILEDEAEEAAEANEAPDDAASAPLDGGSPALESEAVVPDMPGDENAVVGLDLPDMPPAPSAPAEELADAYLKVLEAEGESAESDDGLRLVAEAPETSGAQESVQPGVSGLFADHVKTGPSPDDAVPRELPSRVPGVDTSAYAEDRMEFVLRMATLALWVADPIRAPQAGGFLKTLDETQAFERLLQGGTLDAYLEEQGHFQGNPLAIHLSAALVHTLAFARRLQDNPSLLDRWENPIAARQRLASIRGELYGGTFELEALWLVAEMERLGLWKSSAAESGA